MPHTRPDVLTVRLAGDVVDVGVGVDGDPQARRESDDRRPNR